MPIKIGTLGYEDETNQLHVIGEGRERKLMLISQGFFEDEIIYTFKEE